jgi:hypothetical protein
VASTTDLNEERFTELSAAGKNLLKEKALHFVFVAALDEGKDALESRMAELGVSADVFSLVGESDIPALTDLSEESNYVDYVTELERVGEALFAISEETTREERKLGYGNRGKLLVTAFNTPTVTLSALWKSGEVDGEDWNALFPRRPKR